MLGPFFIQFWMFFWSRLCTFCKTAKIAKFARRQGESTKMEGRWGQNWSQNWCKTVSKNDKQNIRFFYWFCIGFWLHFRRLLGAFWGEKSMQCFDRFLDLFFLWFRSAAPRQRDFSRGAYSPGAPQGGALIARIGSYNDPRDALQRIWHAVGRCPGELTEGGSSTRMSPTIFSLSYFVL